MNFIWILIGVFHSATAALVSDPCDSLNYNELDDPHRSIDYHTTQGDTPICDLYLTQGWYRFTSAAGTMMPTTCPPRLSCGTIVPIWMNGTHPHAADGIVQRQICGNFENQGSGSTSLPCCEMTGTIAVKNCKTFFVYYLVPPGGCPYGYCAGSATPCPAGQVSANGDGMPPCKEAYPIMSSSPQLSDPVVAADGKSFHFDCRVPHMSHHNPPVKYRVTWLFDGKEDPNLLPQDSTAATSLFRLDGALLRNHINTNIQCQVEAYYDGMQQHMGPPIKSNSYYAGIQISEKDGGRLTVDERDWESNVTISSTVPIVCDHDVSCCLLFKLDVDSSNGQEASLLTKCNWYLCRKDWDPKTHMATIQVPVVANKDMVTDGDHQLLLTFEKLQMIGGGNYSNIFTGHKPNPVPVEVIDTKASVCSVTGDPHIHSFDGGYFNLYQVGDYTMCRIPDPNGEIGPFEVTARTWACGRVACVCGLVIREQNDVIIINQCDQRYGSRHTSPTVEYPNGLRQSTVVQRSRNGHQIVVYLPSGTEIKVTSSSSSLNVYMTVSSVFEGECRGICGTNDGDRNNELTHPDGTIEQLPCHRRSRHRCHPTPVHFTNSWRVPLNQSMFENPVPMFPMSLYDHVQYCPCTDDNSGHPMVNCTLRGDVPSTFQSCHGCSLISPTPPPNLCDPKLNPLCGLGGWHRTKRSLYQNGRQVSVDKDVIDAPYNYEEQKKLVTNATITWPSDNGLTEDQARASCENVIKSSQLYSACQNKVELLDSYIADCAEDILMSGSNVFLNDVLQTFTSECQTLLALEPASYVTSPEGYNIMKPEYSDHICLPGCEDHGKCTTGGQCQCEPGWEGHLCHIMSAQGPQLDQIRSGPLCDLRHRACETVYIDATNLDLSEDFACRIQLLDDNGQKTGSPVSTEAHMLSAGRMSCELPKHTKSNQHYEISATNDGGIFGNSLQLRVFDSSCLGCQLRHCNIRTSTCYIDGKCYQNDEKNPQNDDESCQAASLTSWTVKGQTLPFSPTLNGPDQDFLFYCNFVPNSNNNYQVHWLVNGVTIETDTLLNGVHTSMIMAHQLPDAGQLTCQVDLNGATAASNPVNLDVIKV